MSLYLQSDIKLLGDNINEINDRIERKQLEMYEPTKEERIKVTDLILNFIKKNKRKVYGGFAMNKDNEFWQCIRTTEDYREAFNAYIEREGCFINIQSFDKGEYYNVFEKHESLNMETEKPSYDFVLQLESIEMHKLSQIIEQNILLIRFI